MVGNCFNYFILPLYKWVLNMSRYKKTKKLETEYFEYHEKKKEKASDTENQAEIVDLFRKANVESPVVHFTEPIGYGQARSGEVSVFINMYVSRVDIIKAMFSCFLNAKSVFKKRMKDSYNPMYWIDAFLHLPALTLEYLGGKPDHISAKILNIIYWIALGIFSIFKTNVISWIKHLINQVSP